MDLIKALPSTRPPFLILSPLCVALGLMLAYRENANIDVSLAMLTMLGAITAAIAVNTINEYQDFSSGLDFNTIRTPFSGGSGLLVDQPNLQSSVRALAIISTIITIAIGCYLMWLKTWTLFPLGLTGVVIILTYTRWLNKSPTLCYLAPGFGFGLLIVLGAILVQTGQLTLAQLVISFIPTLTISNLLLVNQFPDKKADQAIGRNHLVVCYGFQKAATVFLATSVLNCGLLVLYVVIEILPVMSLIVLLPLCLTFIVYRALARYGERLAEHSKIMALNVVATLTSTLLLSVSLLLD